MPSSTTKKVEDNQLVTAVCLQQQDDDESSPQPQQPVLHSLVDPESYSNTFTIDEYKEQKFPFIDFVFSSSSSSSSLSSSSSSSSSATAASSSSSTTTAGTSARDSGDGKKMFASVVEPLLKTALTDDAVILCAGPGSTTNTLNSDFIARVGGAVAALDEHASVEFSSLRIHGGTVRDLLVPPSSWSSKKIILKSAMSHSAHATVMGATSKSCKSEEDARGFAETAFKHQYEDSEAAAANNHAVLVHIFSITSSPPPSSSASSKHKQQQPTITKTILVDFRDACPPNLASLATSKSAHTASSESAATSLLRGIGGIIVTQLTHNTIASRNAASAIASVRNLPVGVLLEAALKHENTRVACITSLSCCDPSSVFQSKTLLSWLSTIGAAKKHSHYFEGFSHTQEEIIGLEKQLVELHTQLRNSKLAAAKRAFEKETKQQKEPLARRSDKAFRELFVPGSRSAVVFCLRPPVPSGYVGYVPFPESSEAVSYSERLNRITLFGPSSQNEKDEAPETHDFDDISHFLNLGQKGNAAESQVGECMNQRDVFEFAGKSLIKSILASASSGVVSEDNNVTFFSHQTALGEKPWRGFTLGLAKSLSANNATSAADLDDDNDGLFFRTVAALLESTEFKCGLIKLNARFVNLHHDMITDALIPYSQNPSQGLKPRFTRPGCYTLNGVVKTVPIASLVDASNVLELADKNKTVPATHMSSRVYRGDQYLELEVVFTMSSSPSSAASSTSSNSINFVALPEIEVPNPYAHDRQTLPEGQTSNRNLMTLARIVQDLSEAVKSNKKILVPFRDSRLTMLLQRSLSRGKIVFFSHLTPSSNVLEQNRATIRYAQHFANCVWSSSSSSSSSSHQHPSTTFSGTQEDIKKLLSESQEALSARRKLLLEAIEGTKEQIAKSDSQDCEEEQVKVKEEEKEEEGESKKQD